MKYYQTGAHAPVCKYLTKLGEKSGGREVWDIVDTFRMHLPDSREPVWMVRMVISILHLKQCHNVMFSLALSGCFWQVLSLWILSMLFSTKSYIYISICLS